MLVGGSVAGAVFVLLCVFAPQIITKTVSDSAIIGARQTLKKHGLSYLFPKAKRKTKAKK